MFMGAISVLRARDGMGDFRRARGTAQQAWSGSRSQSLRAESGPARNDDPSDWCLPACLTRPACVPLLPPACCLLPLPLSACACR